MSKDITESIWELDNTLKDIKKLLESKDEQISFLTTHNKWLKDNNDKLLAKLEEKKWDI